MSKTSLGTVLPKLTLKDYPVHRTVAWTISLPRKHQIDITELRPKPITIKRRKWMYWFELENVVQWNWLKDHYIPNVFRYCLIDQCHVFPEKNKMKDIHAHAIILSVNPEWDADDFIRKCSHHSVPLMIHHHKNEKRLNFIHSIKFADSGELEWVDYVQKKVGKMGGLKAYVVKDGIHE